MTGSPVSASAERPSPEKGGQRILVCGLNWVGDTIMSMPALQAYRRQHPADRITLLVKPAVAALWRAHAVPDEVLVLEEGFRGAWRTAAALRDNMFERAYVLPHSFRAAWLAWWGGVPERVGLHGHARDWMLTSVVEPPLPPDAHQAYEYMGLMTEVDLGACVEPPRLQLDTAAAARGRDMLATLPHPAVVLLPGAARGPSKRWPAEHFVRTGRRLVGERGCGIAVAGTANEVGLCEKVAKGVGADALNLAGKTTASEWLALLAACDLVICNDSGGMHVAGAFGTPLVAVFGMTDPARTGPLGGPHRILQVSAERSRDIPRDAAEARKSLASVQPDLVYEAALELLEGTNANP